MSEQQSPIPPDSQQPLWGGQNAPYPPGRTGQPTAPQPEWTGQPTQAPPVWGGQPTTLQPGWGGQPGPGGQMPPNGWSQPPGYPPQQAPRKRKKWPWVLLAVFVLIVGGIIAGVASAVNTVSTDINKSKTVVYEVTGTAKDVNVSYTTWNNGNSSTSQEDVTLPWTQKETSSGLFSGGSLIVTVGSGGGTATCSVTIDNGTPMTANASGALSSADCQSG